MDKTLDAPEGTMAAHVHLRVDFDEDWTRGDIWRPLGVLQGFVTLKIGGQLVIDYGVHAMNPSAVSLLRTLESDHVATTPDLEDDARWPLFFCCASLWNRCGIVADFTVRRVDEQAVLTDFLRCKVPRDTVLRVPWKTWVSAVEKLGRRVLRRCPIEKAGVQGRYSKRYSFLRGELKRLLVTARQEEGRLTARSSGRARAQRGLRDNRRATAARR